MKDQAGGGGRSRRFGFVCLIPYGSSCHKTPRNPIPMIGHSPCPMPFPLRRCVNAREPCPGNPGTD